MGKEVRRGAGESGRGRSAGLAGGGNPGTGDAGVHAASRSRPLVPVPGPPRPSLGLPRAARALLASLLVLPPVAGRAHAQSLRLDRDRFTVVALPSDEPLARSLLAAAADRDTFPGLPRPRRHVIIAVAPDHARFREWTGPNAPEWGAAVAFPGSQRIVMQGRRAGSDAGDPIDVLRHELAHLALHEALGDLPPRWFDEGYASYAANEVDRDAVLSANLALLIRGMPSLDSLDAGFTGGSVRAEGTYALAYRAVAELAARDPQRGLTLFFRYWKQSGRFDAAVRSAYGITAAQFEQIWQTRTRRRYGGLALFANLSLAAAMTLFIVLPFYIARRRRDRLRMQALQRADEEAERREAASAIEALLLSISGQGRVESGTDPDGRPDTPPPSSPSPPNPPPAQPPPSGSPRRPE